jgi:hypothetical protein
MVAATSNVVDFAMQNQSNAALTLGCVSIAGVLTYKAVRKSTRVPVAAASKGGDLLRARG